jgi:membrane protease subunit (stomatin/prohibitin family)
MKRIFLHITVAIFSLTTIIMPVFAEEVNPADSLEQQDQQKDECLLVARNCGNSAVSIQDKIERLKDEIAKGRAVYTIEELNNLKQKLDEVSRILDYLLEK